MKPKRTNQLLSIVLLAALVASAGNVWADTCSYSKPHTNADDVGMGGTGTGGTGTIATDTGTGGTGIKLGVYMSEMQIVGSVTQGSAEVKDNGRPRVLTNGSLVCAGETIVTSKSGSVQIRMADDGLISIQPQSQFKIEKFAYTGSETDKSSFVLDKGSCHFVAGKIGKQFPQNNVLKTPSATIGGRDSDHEVTVILIDDAKDVPSGTYDKVNKGQTLMKTNSSEIDIHQDQTGFASFTGDTPVILKESPRF